MLRLQVILNVWRLTHEIAMMQQIVHFHCKENSHVLLIVKVRYKCESIYIRRINRQEKPNGGYDDGGIDDN